MSASVCKFCSTPLKHIFADLGATPISNEYLGENDLLKMEPFYSLCAYVCKKCFLVQLPEIKTTKSIFDENYAYFSSYSDSWLNHAKEYVNMMTNRFDISSDSFVVELASNDGYLLQYFKEKNVKVLGIEPCQNVADAAEKKGIPSIVEFFGVELARNLANKNKCADLIVGNNVLAHVPDINDFVGGMKIILKDDGVITVEFPHLMRLIEFNQFDTIYHEHYSYLSLVSVDKIFRQHGLCIFDVEELPTHGGSLRIFAKHDNDESKPIIKRVEEVLNQEEKSGLLDISTYEGFQQELNKVKRELLKFLINAKESGKKIVGYGAPAKGNTLLNYCGVGPDLLSYTVDRSPQKQGKFLPGTRIPIYAPEKILESKADYVLILPWNLKNEIMEQMNQIRSWGGKFVVPIPSVEILK
jgi:SAM-dependent methyltransferase